MQTFQPNSIRSLLNKRNSRITKLQNEDCELKPIENLSKTTSNFNKSKVKKNDVDLDSLLQAKLIIKGTKQLILDIDHDIQSIRTWRQHQKQLLQQKFRSNKQMSKLFEEQHLKIIEKQLKEDQLENKKIIQKIKIQQDKLKKPYHFEKDNFDFQAFQSKGGELNVNQFIDSQPYILDCISEAEQKLEKFKYGNYNILTDHDRNEAFINDVNNMSQIFTKKNQTSQQQEQKLRQNVKQLEIIQQKKIDKTLLKIQLQEIQDQLKEMEQLLKD